MTEFLIAAVTTACVTFTLTTSPLFNVPRSWLSAKSQDATASTWARATAFAVTCSYCVGHWIALTSLALITRDVGQTALWLFPVAWTSIHLILLYNILASGLQWVQVSATLKEREGMRSPVTQRKVS